MNLLTVDIGNTDIKFGIFRNGVLHEQWRAAGTRAHPEKFSAVLRDSLAKAGAEFGALAYTSVVPDIELVFRKTIQYCFNLPDYRIFAVDPQRIRLPLDFSRYPLEQLGMDRLVNACSARLLYPENALVIVDFGTATTFDLVDAGNQYLGGAITPGLGTFSECLSLKTARLPMVSVLDKTPGTLGMGSNTLACMEAGVGIGYRGLIKELMETARQELGTESITFIATGGLSQAALRLCGLEDWFQMVDPFLTLKGLYQLYEFNSRANALSNCASP